MVKYTAPRERESWTSTRIKHASTVKLSRHGACLRWPPHDVAIRVTKGSSVDRHTGTGGSRACPGSARHGASPSGSPGLVHLVAPAGSKALLGLLKLAADVAPVSEEHGVSMVLAWWHHAPQLLLSRGFSHSAPDHDGPRLQAPGSGQAVGRDKPASGEPSSSLARPGSPEAAFSARAACPRLPQAAPSCPKLPQAAPRSLSDQPRPIRRLGRAGQAGYMNRA